MMNCPKDNTPLETHDLSAAKVQECPSCRGVWFEKGELDKAKNSVDPDLGWMEVDLWMDQEGYNLSLSPLSCPRDGQPMVSIAFTGGPDTTKIAAIEGNASSEVVADSEATARPIPSPLSPIIVDHCLKCGGVWLDQNEFGQIIAALEQELISKPESEYLRESLQEAAEVVAHPRKFASEWRDFLTVTRLMQYRILSENPRLRDALAAYARSTPFK